MYVNIDEKGRLIVPAKLRKKYQLVRRVELVEKNSEIVLRGTVKPDFWLSQGGFLQRELKIKPMSPREVKDAAQQEMIKEVRAKMARLEAQRKS